MSMRLNKNYTAQLSNPESSQYNDLKIDIESVVSTLSIPNLLLTLLSVLCCNVDILLLAKRAV